MIAVCCKFWFNFRYISDSRSLSIMSRLQICAWWMIFWNTNLHMHYYITYVLLYYIRNIDFEIHPFIHSFFISSRRNSSLDDRKWKMSGKYFIQIHVVIEYSLRDWILLVCFSWRYEATEVPRVNFVMREALFEIYTWILCRFIPSWETNK